MARRRSGSVIGVWVLGEASRMLLAAILMGVVSVALVIVSISLLGVVGLV